MLFTFWRIWLNSSMIIWNNGNYLTTQNNIPEDWNLQQQQHSDNLKSHILYPHIIIIEVLMIGWLCIVV
jgi:hypothetical protein